MINEHGIDDKLDKSQGIRGVISGFRINNLRMVVSSGIVCSVPTQILCNKCKVPDGEVSYQAQKVAG
jgi:hypothetical protein